MVGVRNIGPVVKAVLSFEQKNADRFVKVLLKKFPSTS